MLDVGLCFYRDKKSVLRCIESIYEHVGTIWAINGCFVDRIPEKDDGTAAALEQFDNVKISTVIGTEPQKRSKYLQSSKAKHLMVIDSDEFVKGDWKEFYRNLSKMKVTSDIYTLGINGAFDHVRYCWPESERYPTPSPYPRIIINPNGYTYFEAHALLLRKSDRELLPLNRVFPLVPGITIYSNNDLRTQEWTDKTYDYQVKLIKKETPIRNELNF